MLFPETLGGGQGCKVAAKIEYKFSHKDTMHR